MMQGPEKRRALTLLACTVGCFLLAGSAPGINSASIVKLLPGSNLQAAVDAAPAGTNFILEAGVYRMQSVAPKNGDVFIGQGTVDLNGSQILTFRPDKSGMWVATVPPLHSPSFPCIKSSPLCSQIQDLFLDNVIQEPATTQQGLKPGWWYYDIAGKSVYLATNPAGHTIEIGATAIAFYGAATGVQIRKIIVEKYANRAQQGAIGNGKEGSGWIVSQVEARWNHGAGVELGPGSTLSSSYIHHNGQLGIAMGGANCQVTNNEISWNNYAGFEPDWEAGGSKFWETTDLLVKSNFVHDNRGAGLWSDYNNVGTVYDTNTVTNNLRDGIKHEISYRATIRNNIVKGNGNTPTAWLWNAQIALQNSSGADVYGNVVEVPSGGGNGITVINQSPGRGSQGPWVGANNKVYNNTITYLGSNGASGLGDDTGGQMAVGNNFNSNHYILKVGSSWSRHWNWFRPMSWGGFQAAGEEEQGSCCS